MSTALQRAAIVRAARRWIGTPYLHQASARGVGCDCLGLVRGIWREVIGPEPEGLPPYTRDWGEISAREHVLELAARHLPWIEAQYALPGDLLVFRWHRRTIAKHMGVLATSDRFIHASEPCGVTEVVLAEPWRSRVAAHFRFPQSPKD